MQVLRCLIVDDEPGAHYVLEAHIEKVQALQIWGIATMPWKPPTSCTARR